MCVFQYWKFYLIKITYSPINFRIWTKLNWVLFILSIMKRVVDKKGLHAFSLLWCMFFLFFCFFLFCRIMNIYKLTWKMPNKINNTFYPAICNEKFLVKFDKLLIFHDKNFWLGERKQKHISSLPPPPP